MSATEFNGLTPEENADHDGDPLREEFRIESAFEDAQPLHVVHLSEDPRGARRVYFRDEFRHTAQWTVDAHPLL